MKRSFLKRTAVVLALASCVAAGAVQSVTAANDPVRLSFQKSIVDPAGVWEGTVAGDVTGTLRTQLKSLRVSGPVWHVTFDWTVVAGPRSFVATLDGTLNTSTGQVVMNGTVTQGWLLGARVHEEGQLVDPATLTFIGSIRLMPATA